MALDLWRLNTCARRKTHPVFMAGCAAWDARACLYTRAHTRLHLQQQFVCGRAGAAAARDDQHGRPGWFKRGAALADTGACHVRACGRACCTPRSCRDSVRRCVLANARAITQLLEGRDGSPVDAADNQVTFRKEGSPEDTAGPFYDDRFDDSALQARALAAPNTLTLHSAPLAAWRTPGLGP